MIKTNEGQIGVSTVSFIPVDDCILIKGTAYNSALSVANATPDEKENFKLHVAGYGAKVKDVELKDEVVVMPNSLKALTIPENEKSFEKIHNHLRSLRAKELEDFINSLPANNKKLEFEEYFVIRRYEILGIFTKDTTRNAIYNSTNDDVDVSNIQAS